MRRAHSAGKVSILGLAMIAGAAGAIYYGAIFWTPYVDNIDVAEAVTSAFNQFGLLYADERILGQLKERLGQIGSHRELNDQGELVEVRGLGVGDDAITLEHNPDGSALVQVRYTREVRLVPSNRWTKVSFAPKRAGVPAGRK